jgi:hypothetical protein
MSHPLSGWRRLAVCGLATAGLAVLLAGCAAPRRVAEVRVPPFARLPYEAFSRTAVVAIALREWRLFGSPIDDAPPGSQPPSADKPESDPGLWQRVGEYWWLGMDPNAPESSWTGKHDGNGHVFPPQDDGDYAWSAAFISYVMRIAGAGGGFPYAADHAHYINIAKQMAQGTTSGWLVTAERPESYAPQPGDLVCFGRGRAGGLRYDDLPTPELFPAHCDIVVQPPVAGTIAVIGGNVDDAVTLKHVPVTPDGRLAMPDGAVLDTRYPWMTVLRLLVGPVA